jgi:hypothetical protein
MSLPSRAGGGLHEGGRGGLFAAGSAFLLAVDGQGLGGAVLGLGQGEQSDGVPDHFAIQGQAAVLILTPDRLKAGLQTPQRRVPYRSESRL